MQRRSRKPPRSRSKASSATRSRRCCPAPRSPSPIRRHRADPHGGHRRRRPLCGHVAAARRAVPGAGRADRVRQRGARRHRLQRRPARGASTSRCSCRPCRRPSRSPATRRSCRPHRRKCRRTIDRQAFENAAGEGAQLLPPADARLERRREPAPARTPSTSAAGEVWNFGTYVDGTNNHSKWLTLQRAPQLGSSGFAIETVKEVQLITNQFSAEFGGHSAGVSSMITKTGTNAVERLGVRDDPARRSGRGTAAGADRQRREGQGAVQPAAVRRHRRRPAGPATRCSSSAATSGGASAARWSSRRPRHRAWWCRRRPTSTRATAKVDMRFSEQQLAWRPLQHGALEQGQRGRRPQPAGHRLHLGQQRRHRARHVHDGRLRQAAERGARPVLALYRSPRREVRVRVDSARQGYSTSGGNDQGTWGVLPEETYDLSTTRLAVVGQPHDEDRRVVHLRRDRAAVRAAAERPSTRSPARRPRRRPRSSSRSRSRSRPKRG